MCVVSGSGGQPSLSGTVSMYSAPIEAGLGAYLFNTGSIHSTGQRLAFGTLTPPERPLQRFKWGGSVNLQSRPVLA